MNNAVSMPKTDSFRFRINPEVRREIEEIYSKSGLTLTQAINIFIQQSLNAGGLPFPATTDNAEYLKAQSMQKLLKELELGKNSGELMSEDEAYARLGVEL